MSRLSRKEWFLLVFLTVCWGLNWPIMKFGVSCFPPVTFRALGMIGALPVLYLFARMKNESLSIPSGQLWPLIRLAVPNVLIWNMMIILGVRMLSSGRAAILGYTMPVWAVLAGYLIYREKLNRAACLGIACAAAGALLLLSGEFSAISGKPLGSILVLIGAASWGYGTVAMKRTVIPMSSVAMTFWLIALSALALTVYSLIFESANWYIPADPLEWAAFAYNGILVFGFANIVWIQMARKLPPVASSLSVMMIPVVGVFSGAWLLGETPRWQDYVAMILILMSMSTVLLKPSLNKKT